MILFQATIVDPAKLSFTDLSGHERVGVINRNTKEKVTSVFCMISRHLHSQASIPTSDPSNSMTCPISMHVRPTVIYITTASTEAVTLAEEPPTVAGGPSTLQCRPNVGVSGD